MRGHKVRVKMQVFSAVEFKWRIQVMVQIAGRIDEVELGLYVDPLIMCYFKLLVAIPGAGHAPRTHA
jgi:hypothetical protein